MSRLCRHARPGPGGYTALTLFVVTYLAAMTLVLAPGVFEPSPTVSADTGESAP